MSFSDIAAAFCKIHPTFAPSTITEMMELVKEHRDRFNDDLYSRLVLSMTSAIHGMAPPAFVISETENETTQGETVTDDEHVDVDEDSSSYPPSETSDDEFGEDQYALKDIEVDDVCNSAISSYIREVNASPLPKVGYMTGRHQLLSYVYDEKTGHAKHPFSAPIHHNNCNLVHRIAIKSMTEHDAERYIKNCIMAGMMSRRVHRLTLSEDSDVVFVLNYASRILGVKAVEEASKYATAIRFKE